ncbi:MAG TPA: TIGR03621 family F420-dependent LLM class oxidoreductase [Acidimicrobiia bacterium]|nr:TIGR03621 family F420-dependent LLM class oxidoreductase [Acidimicrobiia bacterium]
MAHNRKFRFGVMAPSVESAQAYRETAQRAEALGYSTLYVPDHFVDHPFGPFPAMAMAAEATKTLRVGSLVLGNDYRHPVVLARDAATLDLLSDGRLELGVGAGWMTVDYEKAGMPLDPPGVRIARLAEALAIVKGLMVEGPLTFAGEHYRITELEGMPKPVQRPHPPIVVGGGGKKVLSLAAREADIVGINANLKGGTSDDPSNAPSMNPASTDEKLRWVRDAAGARFDDLEIQAFAGFVHFTDDSAGLASAMAPAFDATPEEVLDSPVGLVGTVEEMIETLERRRERWQMTYHVVNDDVMEQLAPVVARLAGT